MPASLESERERTEPSTQDLPTIPAVQEMNTWDKKKVLRWIQQRNRNILEDDDLDNFNKAAITGRAFLDASVEFFNKFCGLSPGASLGLVSLVNEVKEGKFILWM